MKRLFERARDRVPVFVGVTWQYKSKTPPPDTLGAQIDRLHFQVNVLTEEITKQAEKITDAEEQDRYLKKMRRWQLKELRTEDEEEKGCHSKNALDARFRDNVRETRVLGRFRGSVVRQAPRDAQVGWREVRVTRRRDDGGRRMVGTRRSCRNSRVSARRRAC